MMNAVETWVKSYIGIQKAGSDGIRGEGMVIKFDPSGVVSTNRTSTPLHGVSGSQ